mgnify:CR=1 FL=1
MNKKFKRILAGVTSAVSVVSLTSVSYAGAVEIEPILPEIQTVESAFETELSIPENQPTANEDKLYSNGFNYTLSKEGITIISYIGGAFDIVIPSEIDGKPVIAIGKGAFKLNKAILSVDIPGSVKVISNDAFLDCYNLSEVKLHEGLEEINEHAFSGTRISEIYYPSTIKKMDTPFSSCESLTKVTFGEGVESIAANSFSVCTSIEKVDIPETVKTIGEYAFFNCKKLADVTLHEGLEEIYKYAFYGTSINEIYMPSTIKTTVSPFVECDSLSKVVFGKGIEKIPSSAFTTCKGITEIDIPETVKTIEKNAFFNCNNLSKVTFHEGLEVLGEDSFYATKISEIYFPSTVTEAGLAFRECHNVSKLTLGKGLTAIPKSAFANCSGFKTVEIPETVTTITQCAFMNNDTLTEIDIPESVTTIEEMAFEDCSALTKVTLHEGLEILGRRCFAETGIKEVYMPLTVKKAINPFYDCSALSKITFAVVKSPNVTKNDN